MNEEEREAFNRMEMVNKILQESYRPTIEETVYSPLLLSKILTDTKDMTEKERARYFRKMKIKRYWRNIKHPVKYVDDRLRRHYYAEIDEEW